MKNNMLKGWNDVFKFTFVQNIKEKLFIMSTVLIAVILFCGLMGVNVYLCYSSTKKDDTDKIDTIYFVNKTELDVNISDYDNIEIINDEDKSPDKKSMVIILTEEKEKFILKCNLAKESEISKKGAMSFLDGFSTLIEVSKYDYASLNDIQKQVMFCNVSGDAVKVGEKAESVTQQIIGILFPLFVCIILFVMIMLYGSSISKTMIAEKSSKLLETLLVSVRPYAVVAGKILAMSSLAILQFTIWILSAILGYASGNLINNSINPSYKSEIHKLLSIIKSGKDAFGAEEIIIAALALCVGFFMYCVIAGAVSAGVKKAEELSSALTLFQIPVFAGYFAVCMVPVSGNEMALDITRYIPFSAAYRISADVLIGNMTAGQAAISTIIMLVTSLILIFITGKIYKKKLF
ncbi:MAG: ABC transporter permease [Lachnospiraceae bacterium]|nr:ABC transporter permease [Lachnospiraceae bacterium]